MTTINTTLIIKKKKKNNEYTIALVFKEVNTKLDAEMPRWLKATLEAGIFIFFNCSFVIIQPPPPTSQTRSFEALTCCKCSFSKRLQHISVRSRIAWILYMGDDSEVCQWGTHCSVPEPSPEIRGDFLKWDKSRLAGLTRLEPAVYVL